MEPQSPIAPRRMDSMLNVRLLLALGLGLAAASCSDSAKDAPQAEAPARGEAPPSAPAPARVDLADVAAAPSHAADREEAPIDLNLRGTDVVVTVVDAQGNPAPGVKVVGCTVDASGAPKGRIRWAFAETTNARGEAIIPARRAGDRHAAALFGRAYALSSSDDPLHIVLPAAGSLHIDLSALDAEARVRVSPVAEGRRSERFDAAAGTVLEIDGVLLGERYRIHVASTAGRASLEVDGPTRAGEVVRVQPDFEPMIELRARLVDASGTPLVGVKARADQQGYDRPGIGLGPSDAEGRVSAHVRSSAFFTDIGEPVRIQGREATAFKVAARTSGTAVLPPAAPPGVHDLGDVVLGPIPLIAGGRVVDRAGRAVAGVRVDFDVQLGSQLFGLGAGDRRRSSLFELNALPSITTGEDGAFAFHAPVDEEMVAEVPLGVTVRQPGAATERLFPCEYGDGDLVLELPAPGTLRVDGSRVPPGLWDQIQIRLLLPSGSSSVRLHGEAVAPEHRAGDDAHASEASWQRRLDSGVYGLEIRAGGITLQRIQGIDVPAGGEASDPRLLPLLLNERIAARTVVVQRADGTPIKGARAVYAKSSAALASDFLGVQLVPGGEGPGDDAASLLASVQAPGGPTSPHVRWRWGDATGEATGSDGVLTLAAGPERSLRTAVTAAGYRPHVLTEFEDGQAVTLEPLARVTLVFAAGSEGVDDLERSVRLDLEPIGSDFPWGEGSGVAVRKAPFEATALLPPGVPFQVSGLFSRWDGAEFVVPEPGGRVVIQPTRDL